VPSRRDSSAIWVRRSDAPAHARTLGRHGHTVNTRPATVAAVAVILIVGFAIGGWLAFMSRPSGQAPSTTTATVIRTAAAVPTAAPIAAATEAPTPIPSATLVPTTKPAPTAVATTAPTAASPVVAVRSVPAGSWELDEANAQVGTIVWAADIASSSGKNVVLNAHKQSVGGRPAVPCERRTSLHAEFPAGTTTTSVPFREVNCEGIATTGEMRVSSIPGSDESFSGSFWRNGVKLGDFSARRR
jgi:hypothetical protein